MKYNAFIICLLLTKVAAGQPPVEELPRYAIHEPVRLTESYQRIEPCILIKAPDFRGEAALIVGNTDRRTRGVHLEGIYVDGNGLPGRGIVVRNNSASTLINCRVWDCGGSGLVGDSLWNDEWIGCQAMNCGERDGEPAAQLNSDFARKLDPGHSAEGFWREGTNDVRVIGGRYESNGGNQSTKGIQFICRETTDVAFVGVKFHGDPSDQGRANSGPLVELIDPRGPHIFCGITLAHGSDANALVLVRDVTKRCFVRFDGVDTEWSKRRLIAYRNVPNQCEIDQVTTKPAEQLPPSAKPSP